MQVQSIQNRHYGLNQTNSTKMNSNPQAQTQVQNNSLPNYGDCVSFGMASKNSKIIADAAKEFFKNISESTTYWKDLENIEKLLNLPDDILRKVLLDKKTDVLGIFTKKNPSYNDWEILDKKFSTHNFLFDVSYKIKNEEIKEAFFAREHGNVWKNLDFNKRDTSELIYQYLDMAKLISPKAKGEAIVNNYSLLSSLFKNSNSKNFYYNYKRIMMFSKMIEEAGEHKEGFYKKFGLKPFIEAGNVNDKPWEFEKSIARDSQSETWRQIETLKPEVQKEIFLRDGLDALYSAHSLSRMIMGKLLSFGDDTAKIYLDKGAEVAGNLLKQGKTDTVKDFLSFAATKLKQEPRGEFCSKHGLKIFKSAMENSQPEVAVKALRVVGTLEQIPIGEFLLKNSNDLYTLTRKSGDTKLLDKLLDVAGQADDETQNQLAKIIEKAEANLEKEAAEAKKTEKK